MAADHNTATSTPSFTAMADLASTRVGGRALAANDEFFAPKANLLNPEPAIFIAGKFTPRGKWMDGWETRRRRTPGHDWCVVELGMRGRGPRHQRRHQPFHRQLPVALLTRGDRQLPAAVASGLRRRGCPVGHPRAQVDAPRQRRQLLSRWPIVGRGRMSDSTSFPTVASRGCASTAKSRWTGSRSPRRRRAVDLASITNGGLVIGASDMHFGAKDNMIMPGRATNMGDGWETRRRRGPGYDWAIVRLGTTAVRFEDRDRHQPLQGQLSGQRLGRRLSSADPVATRSGLGDLDRDPAAARRSRPITGTSLHGS